MLKGCLFCIEDQMMEANLILLDLFRLNVILGIDWLFANHAYVDFYKKEVIFR